LPPGVANELEGGVVSGLRDPSDGIRDRLQLVVQRGRFYDFSLGLEFVENFLAHLQLFIRTLRGLAAGNCNS